MSKSPQPKVTINHEDRFSYEATADKDKVEDSEVKAGHRSQYILDLESKASRNQSRNKKQDKKYGETENNLEKNSRTPTFPEGERTGNV